MSFTISQSLPTKKRVLNIPSLDRISLNGEEENYQFNNIGSIPIYASSQVQPQQQIKIGTEESQKEDDLIEDDSSEEYELVHYLESKSFAEYNKETYKELSIISIKGFKNLNNLQIEQLLNLLLKDYKWFSLADIDDAKILFVKILGDDVVNSLKKLQGLQGFKILDKEISIDFAPGTLELLKNYDDLPSITSKDINQLTDFINSKIKTPLKKQSSEMDYIIDEHELKGIPEDLLPQLKRDIKEFRLNVIEIEKKKKEKEKRDALKRHQAQLRLLYKQFSKGEVKQDDEDDEDYDDDDEEDDGLTDEQFEDKRKSEENEKILKEYEILMKRVENQEHKNKELVQKLNQISSYSSKLSENINLEDAKKGIFFNGSSVDRAAESKRDEEDRIKEDKELEDLEKLQKSEDFLATLNISSIPSKSYVESIQTNDDDHDNTDNNNNDNDDNNNNKGNTSSEINELKDKINDADIFVTDDELDSILSQLEVKFKGYIVKYLEIEDEELLEYIQIVIKEFKNKSKLIEELQETFDDDGITIGNEIWNDLKNLIK
ncbi:hypothetical protein WICMUC_001969 [Wickerhamomyces mucosus]|uniref:Uncharacterized protein n=1 Tax=Wickerhamomyces mucosus TaxID=1378264 RepID=A0A9P8PRM9_9ASCO|nr:hypothetical protein WICMUC_001969 [Wickerhamomyces mucosus]